MVGQSGMSDTLISFAAGSGSPFGGGDLVDRVLSDTDGRRMVEQLLREQKEVALDLLSAHRHLVAALRDALIDRHELIGHEITDVLVQAKQEQVGQEQARSRPLDGSDHYPFIEQAGAFWEAVVASLPSAEIRERRRRPAAGSWWRDPCRRATAAGSPGTA